MHDGVGLQGLAGLEGGDLCACLQQRADALDLVDHVRERLLQLRRAHLPADAEARHGGVLRVAEVAHLEDEQLGRAAPEPPDYVAQRSLRPRREAR